MCENGSNVTVLSERLHPFERLTRAIRLMQRAMDANREAAAELATAVREIRTHTSSIETNLAVYSGRLAEIAETNARAARRTEETMRLLDAAFGSDLSLPAPS